MGKVLVDAGALRMALNMMERCAERHAEPTMKEAADELRKTATVYEAPSQSAQEKDADPNLRKAVFTVLEGFTLPDGVRKILETAYYSATSPATAPLDEHEKVKAELANALARLAQYENKEE